MSTIDMLTNHNEMQMIHLTDTDSAPGSNYQG